MTTGWRLTTRGGSSSAASAGKVTIGFGAILALVGGATPIQLCLMLSRVASRRSTCCCARLIVGTRIRATARVAIPARTDRRTDFADRLGMTSECRYSIVANGEAQE